MFYRLCNSLAQFHMPPRCKQQRRCCFHGPSICHTWHHHTFTSPHVDWAEFTQLPFCRYIAGRHITLARPDSSSWQADRSPHQTTPDRVEGRMSMPILYFLVPTIPCPDISLSQLRIGNAGCTGSISSGNCTSVPRMCWFLQQSFAVNTNHRAPLK